MSKTLKMPVTVGQVITFIGEKVLNPIIVSGEDSLTLHYRTIEAEEGRVTKYKVKAILGKGHRLQKC